MDIRKDFPFEHCDNCPEFILSVNEEVLFYDFQGSTRVLTIRCKNEGLCRRLENNRKELERK